MAPKRKAVEAHQADNAEVNWASSTVAQLKFELTTRGLFTTGKKADLIARLEAHGSSPVVEVAQVEPDNEDEEEEVDWKSYTVAELKEELKSRGLHATGKKADLVTRLEAHDNGEAVDLAPAPKRAKKADAPAASQAPAPTQKAKAKPKKKALGDDIVFDGLLAEDVVIMKHFNPETGERRVRDFVPAPDDKFKQTSWRIRNERMFMLDRQKSQDRNGYPCEKFDIAGSTGNIYNVSIGRSPSCTCMDAKTRGQKCKHINYTLIVILKALTHLSYQLAFMSEELEYIFANAPVTRAPELDHDHDESDESIHNGTRKPVEGECPICVFDMEPGEELVWCKAACGQNFHKECFEQWKRSKNGGRVTCVYCRSEWQEASPKKPAPGSLASLKESAQKIGSYKNIGSHPMYQEDGGSAHYVDEERYM